MIKKHLLHFLALPLAVLSLQSCITDDSTAPLGTASQLSLEDYAPSGTNQRAERRSLRVGS